ncbi:hypothetical protein CsatB_029588 [Cannabis sativa]
MFSTKQVVLNKGLFMMILLMSTVIIALQYNHGVYGARLLSSTEKMEDLNKVQAWRSSTESSTTSNINEDHIIDGEQGFYATINREVPSCPDPLHNR